MAAQCCYSRDRKLLGYSHLVGLESFSSKIRFSIL